MKCSQCCEEVRFPNRILGDWDHGYCDECIELIVASANEEDEAS